MEEDGEILSVFCHELRLYLSSDDWCGTDSRRVVTQMDDGFIDAASDSSLFQVSDKEDYVLQAELQEKLRGISLQVSERKCALESPRYGRKTCALSIWAEVPCTS
ncbi:uncharacterized protein LOC134337640 isoform X2 [Mobula hypostoma]|uniref:uncharacterized protein LOC134337640 isoform X2 n=1 Tax=Mobula hypostoma TaxID=723540 RepID=UPI002FC34089